MTYANQPLDRRANLSGASGRPSEHEGAITPLAKQPVWCIAAWLTIALLVIWSYGANNIAIPGLPVPLVDVVLVALLVRTRHYWRPFTRVGPGRTILLLLLLLSTYGGVRLLTDFPESGLAAIRGSVFIIEIWAILLGVALMRRLGRDNVERVISIILATALLWFCLYPFRLQISEVSPIVGVQRPARLFSFTSIGFISAYALLWFAPRQTRLSYALSAVALGTLFMAQLRGVFAGLVVAAAVLVFVSRSNARRNVVRRLLVGALAAIAVISLLPPLPGRLGTTSVSTFTDMVATGFGGEGSVGSSLDDRRGWTKATLDAIQGERMGWVFGVGFGDDLTGGFSIGPDAAILTPHNDFLEFYARLGIGSLAWIALWIVTTREMYRKARRGQHLAQWGLGATAVTIAVSLTQPFSSFAYGGLVWWTLVGLALGEQTRPSTERLRSNVSPRILRSPGAHTSKHERTP
jgi:hypothetical protein